MAKLFIRLAVFSLLPLAFLPGCSTTIKTYIPEHVGTIPNGYARIILTRADQLAGSITPLYVMDVGENIKANADISVRLGRMEVQNRPSTMYMPSGTFVQGGFITTSMPTGVFVDIDKDLSDLIADNSNAAIYIYLLSTNPGNLSVISCGNGSRDCLASLKQELETKNGILLDHRYIVKNRSDIKLNNTRARLLGKLESGDTLVWERKPGLMRLGGLMEAQSLVLQPENILIEAGKTYFIDYVIQAGKRWTLREIK
jgi:uncharacterized protein YceK